jgi:hypothetical protein
MSETKKKYDMNSPEARTLIDEIVHGTFVKEGMMVAFPTCFPGASTPIPADESHITSLAITDDGVVYGGTSGRAAHVFVGMFHGVTGVVFDRGPVAEATHCVAVGCGKRKFVACLNGPRGGKVVAGALAPLPFDLIQEWGFSRPPLEELGQLNGQAIIHAVVEDAKTSLVGLTTDHVFTVEIEHGRIELLDEAPGKGRVGLGFSGGVYGQDGPAHLWRYDVPSKKLRRLAIRLPAGDWDNVPLIWARDRGNRILYTADANGTLFFLNEESGFSRALGRTPLAPVGPMAVTHDGRLFGFCGEELARMFCYNPGIPAVTDLGVAVSVLERRRYGYAFGDAVTGRDGQIYFGEDDDLGHLWLYFPRIQRTA